DFHLQVDAEHVRVVRGPWENGHRPAIDSLFRSVARWWTDRAIAVVLSGALDDGAAGIVAIRGEGGMTLVQEPMEATGPDMPLAALRTGAVDEAAGVRALAARIAELCPAGDAPALDRQSTTSGRLAIESDATAEVGADWSLGNRAEAAGLQCPDCG